MVAPEPIASRSEGDTRRYRTHLDERSKRKDCCRPYLRIVVREQRGQRVVHARTHGSGNQRGGVLNLGTTAMAPCVDFAFYDITLVAIDPVIKQVTHLLVLNCTCRFGV